MFEDMSYNVKKLLKEAVTTKTLYENRFRLPFNNNLFRKLGFTLVKMSLYS